VNTNATTVYSLAALIVSVLFAGGVANMYRTRLTAKPERDNYISSAAEAAVRIVREALAQTQADLIATKLELQEARDKWEQERAAMQNEITMMKATELLLRREVDRLRVLVEGTQR